MYEKEKKGKRNTTVKTIKFHTLLPFKYLTNLVFRSPLCFSVIYTTLLYENCNLQFGI